MDFFLFFTSNCIQYIQSIKLKRTAINILIIVRIIFENSNAQRNGVLHIIHFFSAILQTFYFSINLQY